MNETANHNAIAFRQAEQMADTLVRTAALGIPREDIRPVLEALTAIADALGDCTFAAIAPHLLTLLGAQAEGGPSTDPLYALWLTEHLEALCDEILSE